MPSVDGFLNQMRIFCDGRLACISPRCRDDQFFDASWDDLKSHYEVYHADRLPQDEDMRDVLDVESYLACYKCDIERLLAKAQARREEWASNNDDDRAMEKERSRRSLKCDNSVYSRLPEMAQLGVLKDLDKVFRSRYRQFRRLAAKSPSPDLASFNKKLRKKCPKPKDLRRLGNRIFKQVVRGSSPTTLLDIFAFISLSKAMATVMSRRGIQVDLDPGTIDYLAWRTCIEDEVDRGLYDEILIAWFHPRWREESHCMLPLQVFSKSLFGIS